MKLKYVPLILLTCCIPYKDWGKYNSPQDRYAGCVSEAELSEGNYAYLGVAPFYPVVICGDMDLLEDDYYHITYPNLAPINVEIQYEGPENSEAHLVIREVGKKTNGEIIWSWPKEETIMGQSHSTQLTIYPVDGYDRLVIAVVPCILDTPEPQPYKITIGAR